MSRFLSVIFLAVLLSEYAAGQVVPPVSFQCLVNAGVAPTVRSEGLTELTGDVVLQCTGAPTASGVQVGTGNLTLTYNTNITSRLLAGSNVASEALLLIDDPAPANQKVAQFSNGSTVSPDAFQMGTGAGLNFQNGSVPNIFPGTLNNVNQVSFTFPLDGSQKSRVLRVTNVRVNAFNVGGTAAQPGQITVSIGSNPYFGITGATQIVGLVQPGLSTSVTGISAPACTSFNNNFFVSTGPIDPVNPPAGASFISFVKAFPTAIKPPPTIFSSTPGQIFSSEGGFVLPGASNPNSLADFGTRLKATFSNVPSGVRIFVSTVNVDTPKRGFFNGATAQLITPAVAPNTRAVAEILVSNGAGTAVWEVYNPNPSSTDPFDFGVWPSFAANVSGNTPAPGTATVNLSYAPGVAVPSGASGSLSIPRFAPPPVSYPLFTVLGCGVTAPVLSAVPIDPRACYPGNRGVSLIFPYVGNACAPGDTPKIGIVSDNRAVSPSFSVTQDNGIGLNAQNLEGGPLSGGVPLGGAVFITNTAAAKPGTYNPILTVTAPGASNTLNIPFPVTFLPPTTPWFLPQSFDDAGDYESGQTYGGQIFTIFGNNFEPAAPPGKVTPGAMAFAAAPNDIVIATLDSNGKLPNTLGGAQVTFDGVAAPLLFVAANQVAGVAPFAIAGKTSTQVQLIYNGVKSPPIAMAVGAAHISVLSADASGGGSGAILNADGTLNSAKNPAARGSVVTIFASYAGPMNVPGTDGRTTISAPYPVPTGTLSVSIGGVNATDIKYFGNAPTLLETVEQINVTVPAQVLPGSSIPVIVSAGGAISQPWVTIAVK